MKAKRFSGRTLAAAAALGLAAAWAGSALAGATPPPQHRNYVQDCTAIGLEESGDRFYLKARCPVWGGGWKDTRVDLAADIGLVNNALTWGGTKFHKQGGCWSMGLPTTGYTQWLQGWCRAGSVATRSKIELTNRYSLNPDGDIVRR